MSTSVVKVYQFKLNAGVAPEQFIAASRTVDDFLLRVEGFLYRSVSKINDELWQDIIYWDSEEASEKAGALMNEPEFQALVPMLNMDEVVATNALIVTQAYPEMLSNTAKTEQLL